MNIFTKVKNKIPVVGTPSGKHFIVVNCDDDTIKSFAEANKLVVGEPGLWVVHQFENKENLALGIVSLPRRLHPLDVDGEICLDNEVMYPYFYTTPKLELVAKGVYVGTEGEPNPFKQTTFTEETGLKCLKQ